MSDILKFEEWSKQLAHQSGISYLLVFKPHLQQIKDNWNAFDKETAASVNEVMVSLLQHSLTPLLVDLANILCPQMRSEELLTTRLRMLINCGIALNMQNKLEESEAMYKAAIDLLSPLYELSDDESCNVIASVHYNYSRLQVSKGSKEVGD